VPHCKARQGRSDKIGYWRPLGKSLGKLAILDVPPRRDVRGRKASAFFAG
jgi:hypothetical protein